MFKAKSQKPKIKSKGWLDMLKGDDLSRPKTLSTEASSISFSTIERVEDKDGNTTYKEV